MEEKEGDRERKQCYQMSPLSGAAAVNTIALVFGSLVPWPELMIMGTTKGRSAKSRYIKTIDFGGRVDFGRLKFRVTKKATNIVQRLSLCVYSPVRDKSIWPFSEIELLHQPLFVYLLAYIRTTAWSVPSLGHCFPQSVYL